MVSIKDVALLAKVSISTVSLAMNYPERVRGDTKLRIFAAMKQLRYVPSARHRKLPDSGERKQSIALITGEISGPYYYEILRGISETIAINNMEFVMLSGSASVRRHFLDVLNNTAFHGVILTLMGDLTPRDIDLARSQNISVVMCHGESRVNGMGSVSIDNYYIGKLMADHLLNMGYRKIGILGTLLYDDCAARAKGFTKTLQRNGLSLIPEWTVDIPLDEQSGFNAMEALLTPGCELPEAFFCINDEIAIGVIKSLQAHNIEIPKQVAVTGCDNIAIGKYINPPLTTADMPRFEVGMNAVNMVMRQLSGKPEESLVLKGKLIIRESCGYRETQRRHKSDNSQL